MTFFQKCLHRSSCTSRRTAPRAKENALLRKNLRISSRNLLSTLSLLICAAAVYAQKPSLPTEDYGKWEILGRNKAVSPNGGWLAYELSRVNKEAELHIRSLFDDQEKVFPWGKDAAFSEDSRWAAWTVDLSEDEKKKLEKEKKPVRLAAGALDLTTGNQRHFDQVSQFSFDSTGQFLALLGYRPEEPKRKGADLRLLDLHSLAEMTFGNVGEFSWSEEGSLLALAIATGRDDGNGVQVFDASARWLLSLESSGSSYRQLSWRKEGLDLAVLSSVKPASKDGEEYRLLTWRGLNTPDPIRFELDPKAAGVAANLHVAEHLKPQWSVNGDRVALGLRPVEPKEEAEEGEDAQKPESSDENSDQKPKSNEENLPSLQIWHTADVRLFPQQKVSKERDQKRTLLAIWRLDLNKVIQVGTELLGNAEVVEGWGHAVEKLDSRYPWEVKFGRPYHDVWQVDLNSGERTMALEKIRYSWTSAGGKYLLWFDGKDYWSRELSDGKTQNLTRDISTHFEDREYDTPTDLLPPYGVGGWLKNDEAVLLYDRFDVWRVQPDGSGARRLTAGQAEEVIHRVEDLDSEEEFLDPEQPLYFSLHGEWSEQRGYAVLLPDSDRAERLVLEDRLLSGLLKAKRADVLIYRAEARDDSPDIFIGDGMLNSPRQVTRTNPFQDDYAWTRARLLDFQGESGQRLQSVLLYPVNHDPSVQYPMIVYTYEILSSQMHTYEVPDEKDYYNFTAWTQNGYFVLLPDIVYRAREPGISAIEAVRPAIAQVVGMGLVDQKEVGLIGHSWGGYQATYLPTRTDLFAASVAGAALTDFVSVMGQLHWNQGIAELQHWETGQARMEVPYWEDPEAHHRNSPIHKVQDLETPLLMAFGDSDGTVDWDQGTEFFNFARRAGKQMVLIVYEGENHGFRKEANQIDYHRRILEWFGHYLKGEPAAEWIRTGIPLDRLEEERKRLARP